jgi:hypothetical protein
MRAPRAWDSDLTAMMVTDADPFCAALEEGG